MAIRKKDSSESTRMLIAMALVMGIFFAYQSFFAPPVPVVEPVAEIVGPDPAQAVVSSVVAEAAPVAVAQDVPERTLALATSEIHATLSSHGGSPRQLELPNVPGPLKVTPVWLAAWESIQGERIFKDWFSAPYGEDPGTEKITSENAVILAAGTGPSRSEGDYFLQGSGPWIATRTTPEGLRLTKTWAATENPNVLSVQVLWENTSSGPVAAELWVGSYDQLSAPGGMMSRYESLRQAFGYVDGDMETLENITDIDEDGPESFEGRLRR